MRKWSRYLVGVVAVTGLWVLANRAGAETCTLELKRVDLSARTSSPDQVANSLARNPSPQTFFQQLGGPGGMIVAPSTQSKRKFSDVVKKEPTEYVADTPFRGVAELGSGYYGFVLDAAPPETEEEAEKNDAEDDEKAEKKEAAKKEAEKKELVDISVLSMLGRTLGSSSLPAQLKTKAVNYSRLYFDLNGNGDLTDDQMIEATSSSAHPSLMAYSVFPTVDLTIDVDGEKLDYAFVFRVQSRATSQYAYANALLTSAAYREGEITLDGQKRRIVLIDYNSNGRFDDTVSFRTTTSSVSPVPGDMLFIDPQSTRVVRSYYSLAGAGQYYVARLIGIDGRFFDLDVDPSGETLSLEPTSAPIGYVTNPNEDFSAVVYGDQGVLEIAPDDEGKISLPAGEWRLLSYTIDRTEKPNPEAEQKDEEKSVLELLGGALTTPLAPETPPKPTRIIGLATGDVKPVKVVAGETAEMRFGPPYTPEVTAGTVREGQSVIPIGLSLIGTGGEVCRGITVDGNRPSAPEFTISTTDGEEVDVGKFKYG